MSSQTLSVIIDTDAGFDDFLAIAYLLVAGNIPDAPECEGNMFVDPEAAQIVFSSGVVPTLVPLDATNDLPLDDAFVDAFTSSTALGGVVKEILDTIKTEFLDQGQPYDAWDPLAGMSVVVSTVLTQVTPACIDQRDPINGLGKNRAHSALFGTP